MCSLWCYTVLHIINSIRDFIKSVKSFIESLFVFTKSCRRFIKTVEIVGFTSKRLLLEERLRRRRW